MRTTVFVAFRGFDFVSFRYRGFPFLLLAGLQGETQEGMRRTIGGKVPHLESSRLNAAARRDRRPGTSPFCRRSVFHELV